LALRLASASPKVRASVIEANEFPDLSRRYGVSAVPQTVFTVANAEPRILVGGGPPERFLAELLTAAGVPLDGTDGEEDETKPTQ
jgi:hypothetical protein